MVSYLSTEANKEIIGLFLKISFIKSGICVKKYEKLNYAVLILKAIDVTIELNNKRLSELSFYK